MKALRSALPSTGVTKMSEAAIGSSYHGKAAGTVEHEVALRHTTAVVIVERPHLHCEPPARAIAVDVNQMIAGAAILAVARRRGRADAQHRDRPVRAGDAGKLAAMVVAVQYRLAA